MKIAGCVSRILSVAPVFSMTSPDQPSFLTISTEQCRVANVDQRVGEPRNLAKVKGVHSQHAHP
jgi:hypothetical protein